MSQIETYYSKFNEDGRLLRAHGRVEFETSLFYLLKFGRKLSQKKSLEGLKILDIGAGTGRYSVALAEAGAQVTAFELVAHNVNIIKKKNAPITALQGNALDLECFENDSFDMVLSFGPLYHLPKKEDRMRALTESKRVLKKEGYLFNAYCMNEYSVLTYGFKENHILESISSGKLDEAFSIQANSNDLYCYHRLEDIDALNEIVGLKRELIFAADGAANYMRDELKKMPEPVFQAFLKYHLATCERMDLMGASFHTVDIVKK